jgi:hypothetical protein
MRMNVGGLERGKSVADEDCRCVDFRLPFSRVDAVHSQPRASKCSRSGGYTIIVCVTE